MMKKRKKGVGRLGCGLRQRTTRTAKKGAMEILEVLVAILMIVAIFALVVMMNTRFSSVIGTYMPYRMAVLMANRLSGSPDLTVTPAAGESAHKNLLSAAKLDGYVKNYKETMPPGTALLCFHWRAVVTKVVEKTEVGMWEFGHNPQDDGLDNVFEAIKSLPAEIYNSIVEHPLKIYLIPGGAVTDAMVRQLLDMAPATYSLPVSVATDAGAASCASAGGTCRVWDPAFGYCYTTETDLDDPAVTKDCTPLLGMTRHCCLKTGVAYTGQAGAILPAMLEVTVWKYKSECGDEKVIQKILDEIKTASGG